MLDDLKNKHGITDRDILAYFKSEFGTSKSSSSKETVGGNAGDASGEQSSSEDDDSLLVLSMVPTYWYRLLNRVF